MIQAKELVDDYTSWLKDKTNLRQIGEWVEITTPYLNGHNDCIQIYVSAFEGGYILTDNGYTLENIEESGCEIWGVVTSVIHQF